MQQSISDFLLGNVTMTIMLNDRPHARSSNQFMTYQSDLRSTEMIRYYHLAH